ncbi:MAG: hypothetical protein ACMXYD_04540 [Candidatus Woesearchaeota archaeon]
MGFSTVFSMLAFLLIFIGMTVFVLQAQTSISTTAQTIQEQQNQQQARIELINQDYEENKEVPWRIQYADEFEKGEFTNTTTQQDSVIATTTQGTYTSPPYDTGHNSNYTTISWSSIGSISFQLRSANTTEELELEDFIGPDTTTSSSYTSNGAEINQTHNNNRYIQYQATIPETAQLQSTNIGVIRQTGHATLQLRNIERKKLRAEETSTYIDGQRTPRTSAHRELQLEETQDIRLWNQAETLTLTVFVNQPATITITNQEAQITTTI